MKDKKKRLIIISLLVFVTVIFSFVAIPSLARLKNRSSLDLNTVWDGSVAASYRSGNGTVNDPYVIATGSELAYFAQSLTSNNYENSYFILKNDIVLNNGVFSYNLDDGLRYSVDGNTSDIVPYQDSYTGINKFSPLNNFKGHFDGQSFRIYGLFITDGSSEAVGLFNNLSGTVENLYVENSVIYGGTTTGGIASTVSGATIKNTLYSGYVIGKNENKSNTLNHSIESIEKSSISEELSEVINTSDININGVVTSIKLTGNLQVDNGSLTINGNAVDNGDFNIDLGNTISNITVIYTPSGEASYNLTNLNYSVSYNNSYTSGIVGSGNVNLDSVVNKADVYGGMFTSGLLGKSFSNSNIIRSYNTGNINGDNSSGIISYINSDSVSISYSYNSGSASYSFVQNINGSNNINISNSFSISDGHALGSVVNSSVNVNNVAISSGLELYSGSVTGGFSTVNSNEIKDFAKNSLGFYEYEKNSNDHVWIYDNSSLPILFIDDQDLVIGRININNYSWNNYSKEISTLKFSDSVTFNIEDVDSLRPSKNIYYYISNGSDLIDVSELDSITFTNYNGVVSISEQGIYIVYAKIVDYNDKVTYLNSDLLIIDLSGSDVTISIGDSNYTDFNSDSYRYINGSVSARIDAYDDLSGVKSIKYYLSDSKLSLDEVKEVEDWINYTGSITLDSLDEMNLYARVEDNCNYITYVNTDTYVIDGYKIEDMTGVSQISKDSTLAFNYSFSGNLTYTSSMKHSIIVNRSLPSGVKITLVDLVNGGAYKYVVDDSDVTKYDFTLFKEIGTVNNTLLRESRFSGKVNENFNIIFDFSDTSITDIESYTMYLNLYKGSDVVLSTLLDNIRDISIVGDSYDVEPSLVLNTDFDDTIRLNSNSVNDIGINASINYKSVNGNSVYNTNYSNKNLYLAIKLIDGDGNNVLGSVDNIIYKFNDTNYYADNDGIVRISTNSSNLVGTLSIITTLDNLNILNGNYNFVMGVYTGYDKITDSNIDYSASIPAVMLDSNYKSSYDFNVLIDGSDRIIEKGSNKTLSFDIIKQNIYNPRVMVSLYEKKEITAYDQSYKLVDLSKYVNNSLNSYSDKVYSFDSSQIDLVLNTNRFNKNGYLLLFELYSGDKKVEEVRKYIIVR